MRGAEILLAAGEASGDAIGAGLVAALRARGVEARFRGVGGPAMAAAGVELLGDSRDLAVVGVFEVATQLPRILTLMQRVRSEMRRHPPDLFVPIDSPDFNFRLACTARACGIPVVYCVAPQLWAWRARRVRALRRDVHELLVLFPFEEAWFRSRGVNATYVGHPLVDAIRSFRPDPALSARLGIPGQEGFGLLLPGSRPGVVRRHMPVLRAATQRLATRFPGLRWLVRQAAEVPAQAYGTWVDGERVQLTKESVFELATAARVVVSASGTASFEAALTGTPLLVFYRVAALTWALAHRMVSVPWIAMANLASERSIVPELLQGDFTAQRVASEVTGLLTDNDRRARMRDDLLALRERFGPPGAFARAAERIAAALQWGKPAGAQDHG